MHELIVNKEKDIKTICLVKDGELIERYIENNEVIERLEGNIYIGKVEDILQGMQAAFINIGEKKNGLIHFSDIIPKIDITTNTKRDEELDKKVLKEKLVKGRKILIQVKKDSTQTKGARLTTHINLVGKHLVLMPETTIVTVSQKITDINEKKRIKEFIQQKLPQNIGAIIRTSAVNKTEEELEEDLSKLLDRWKAIKKAYDTSNEYPKLIEENNNIINKIILDTIEQNIKNIYVNNNEDYEEIQKYVKTIDKNGKIKVIFNKNEDLLDKYELRKQIEKSNKRKIWLNCGGFITIDKTEALTAIDVNSGKYTGNRDLEDTILKVNREATTEIAKQIRVRDIGGIIVIDYIDMKDDEHKKEIIKLLEEKLKEDRSKTQIMEFTKLNLLELTRKHIFSNNIEKKEDTE